MDRQLRLQVVVRRRTLSAWPRKPGPQTRATCRVATVNAAPNRISLLDPSALSYSWDRSAHLSFAASIHGRTVDTSTPPCWIPLVEPRVAESSAPQFQPFRVETTFDSKQAGLFQGLSVNTPRIGECFSRHSGNPRFCQPATVLSGFRPVLRVAWTTSRPNDPGSRKRQTILVAREPGIRLALRTFLS